MMLAKYRRHSWVYLKRKIKHDKTIKLKGVSHVVSCMDLGFFFVISVGATGGQLRALIADNVARLWAKFGERGPNRKG